MEEKLIGKRLDGRYEIHELLGMGGMAYVYRAYDKVEDRWVAIKVLKEEFLNNSDFLRRFRNESKAIAVLQHPNIVRVYDVSLGDQIQYIAMEYIDGITLKEYIDQQGAIRWQEAVHFMVQILSALECAHEKGIIHRDVKPQNIMLLRDGKIKVTDFGIARFLQSETQTMTDKAIGSVHYISPEQARGDYITDKADIYSVGVTMYEMLTGTLPFNADSAVSVALMQLQAKPKMPSEVNPTIPRGLEQIVIKAMEKNPPDRFRSAAEMLEDIEKFRQNPGIVFNYSYSAAGYKEPVNIDNYETVQTSSDYDDNYEYEEELVKSKRRRKGSMAITGVVIALVVMVIAAGAVVVTNFMKGMQEVEDETIDVPELVGKIYEEEVLGNPDYDDFVLTVQDGNNPDERPGEILKQDPNAGKKVRKGREIILTVNKSGTEKVVIPDIRNMDQNEAIETIKALGLFTKTENIEDEEIELGRVVKTDPEINTEVVLGTQIKIFISTGPAVKEIEIPQGLVGGSLNSAIGKLEAANLVVGEIYYDDESKEAEGTVIQANPKSGDLVKEKSRVDLTVSSGLGSVQKELKFTVELPDINADLEIKVYRNGTVVSTEVINPSYNRYYRISLMGNQGVDEVILQINGQEYTVMYFDFDKERTYYTRQNDFVWNNNSNNTDTSSSESSSSGSESSTEEEEYGEDDSTEGETTYS